MGWGLDDTPTYRRVEFDRLEGWRELAAGVSEPSADVRLLIEVSAQAREFAGPYELHTSMSYDGHEVSLGQVAWVLLNA